jgi:polyisoprenoid-binding protein YceI
MIQVVQKEKTMTVTTQKYTGTYNADTTHSTVGFKIAYMGLSRFGSTFHGLNAQAVLTEDNLTLSGSIPVESLAITEPGLRGHLMSEEFFDAKAHPELTFTSTEIALDGNTLQGEGILTIKGISNPVKIEGTLQEPIVDAYGNERIGMELRSRIDRTDYEMKWNNRLPSGDWALSNYVDITVEIQAVRG